MSVRELNFIFIIKIKINFFFQDDTGEREAKKILENYSSNKSILTISDVS